MRNFKIRIIGALVTSVLGLTVAVPVSAESDNKKDKLIEEYIEISYKPLVEIKMTQVPYQVKTNIKPGRSFQGQDISTDAFWNSVSSEYENKKAQLSQPVYEDLKAFLAAQYTEDELRQVLKILKSDIFKKMVATQWNDQKNPTYGDQLEKRFRKDLYKIVHQEVKRANLAGPRPTTSRTVASED